MKVCLPLLYLLLLCFIFSPTVNSFAQGDFCVDFQEFCPDDGEGDVTFPAGVNTGFAEPGNNYSCLSTTPNPAWYYIQIGQEGNITIDLTNSNDVDIDFALWGPFPDLNVAEASCGSLPSPIDCSYSPSSNETVFIPSTNENEIYILLITNFSNLATNVLGEVNEQGPDSGLPACCQTPLNTGLECPDPTFFSCGCWTGGIIGTLPVSNPAPAPPGFCGTTENQQWITFESCWCAVSLDIEASNCQNSGGLEVQLFSDCDPFTAVSECITVENGMTMTLPSLTGGDQIDCVPGEFYTILLDGLDGDICNYTITANAIPVIPPEFTDDTIAGPTEVCQGDTITYEFPAVLNAEVCDVSFSGEAEIIDVSHDSFTVVFGATGGTLCAIASNCAGTNQLCIEVQVFSMDFPPLSTGEVMESCDNLGDFYTVEFVIANGNPPYLVDGLTLDGNTFVSAPIPTSETYSFVVDDSNPCVEELIVSGEAECPCDTDPGVLEDSFAELCSDDILQIEFIQNPVLDINDVLVFVMRDPDGNIEVSNTSGQFQDFAGVIELNTIYTVCVEVGNDDGTGNPDTDHPCFSVSNCKQVVFYEDISIDAEPAVELTCNEPSQRLSPLIFGGSGNYIFSWTDPSGVVLSDQEEIEVDVVGTYTLTASDLTTSCASSFSYEVTRAADIEDLMVTLIDPTCYNDRDGRIVIDSVTGGAEPFVYSLDDAPYSANTELISLESGEYSLRVQDVNGCEFETTVSLKNPTEVLVSLVGDTIIELGQSASLTAIPSVTESITVSWMLNQTPQPDTLLTLDSVFLESVIASVMVSDSNGCTASDRLRINVAQDDPIFVPTAFSPNDDGINDRLNVYGDQSVALIEFMRVYDRWGNLLFEQEDFMPNDTGIGWDGLDDGERNSTGVYVYVLQALYINGRSETFTGDVTILR